MGVCFIATSMHGIQAASVQMIADWLCFSTFTTSTPCGHASRMGWASFPRAGMLPFFDMQGTGLCEPSRALCTAWAQHATQQFCTSCLASSFQLSPAFTPSKTWAFKPPKGVQGGWENASHIYRGGWAYSFHFKGCNFAGPRTERLSTCRQLRVTITRLYRSIEEFPVLCMCLPFVYRTFLSIFCTELHFSLCIDGKYN